MPVTIAFSKPLNVSCQIGDTAYYVPTQTSAEFKVNSANIVMIGVITGITDSSITIGTHFATPTSGLDFIFFSKDNKANLSSALGYYAEVKMQNTETDCSKPVELFSVGVDIFESSK